MEFSNDVRTLKIQLADEHEIARILFNELTRNWTDSDRKAHIFYHDESTCPICNCDRSTIESI
jgi:hypothetical protein